jgi:uncharacterized protein (DUF1778 family)
MATTQRIDLRLPGELKALFARAAAYTGTSLSTFLISAAEERAKEVVAEHEAITLSRRDWNTLFAAIDNTEKPRPKLEAAAKRYLKKKTG